MVHFGVMRDDLRSANDDDRAAPIMRAAPPGCDAGAAGADDGSARTDFTLLAVYPGSVDRRPRPALPIDRVLQPSWPPSTLSFAFLLT